MSEPSPQFRDWAEQAVRANLPDGEQIQQLGWHRLSGDAGFRQYFRLDTKPPTLAVLAPPATEDSAAFVGIANYLREHGVRTPRVLAQDLAEGYLLVEDLGTDLLLEHLNAETVNPLYGEALTTLLKLQQIPPQPELFPAYSRAKLRTELEVFSEWFIAQLLRYEVSEQEQQMIAGVFKQLEDSALEQPQVITHRDFHSRNLIYTPDGPPGVIDFQDAVVGPITYDLVSLLRDCYLEWPQGQVERWALAYANMAADVGLLDTPTQQQFLRWFDWMGLQRHIKVLGVFARLSLRDDKHGYLRDLSRVISYVRSVAKGYPEMAEFLRWFDRQLMPLAERQSWYVTCASYQPEPK